MDIIFYHPTFDTPFWIAELEKQLPAREFASGNPAMNNPLTMRWSGIRR